MVTAIDTGADSGSGTQCPPWIFPCDDQQDYYTKLVGRCPAPDFREAEFVTARLGELLRALVPAADGVFVPAAIAQSTGLPVVEHWAVGMRRLPVDPEPQATHASLVAQQTEQDRTAIVAVHTWLDMGDHSPGHNFFRNLDNGTLVSMDHCSALRAFFDGQAASPVNLIDSGNLCDGIAAGSLARTEVANRVRSVTQTELETIVAAFPDDPVHPWMDVSRRAALVTWLIERQEEVANVLVR
jgi:hypothetical protein